MRGLAFLKSLTVALVIWSTCFSSHVWGDEIERLKKGVVVIEASGKNSSKQTGSGFIVRRDPGRVLVVTASHVVQGQENIHVEFYASKNTPQLAKLLHMEGGDPNGLAVLAVSVELNNRDLSVLSFNSRQKVNSGDKVTILGFPKKINIKWATTEGQIIGRSGKHIKFSGLVDGGNSGGPLLKDNQVIGVVTESLGEFSHAVPAQIAQYVLESWGIRFGVTLRSEPVSLSKSYIPSIIAKYGFHHPADLSALRLSPSVLGTFQHEYERKTLKGQDVVIDRATGLMWQQFGSKEAMPSYKGKKYIQQINQGQFSGFADWRLPTVEELASLIEPNGRNERVYIHDVFFPLLWCWTADDVTVYERTQKKLNFYDAAIYVDFSAGAIVSTESSRATREFHVRAVRTMKLKIPN